MNRLLDAVKRRIVEHLACYRTHREVTDLIREEFDVSLTPRHVRLYDPYCHQFGGGSKWIEIHKRARTRFETEIAEIPIAHRALRLRRLGQIHDRAFERGALVIAMNALEQAAKEVGNVYTNVSKTAGVVAHLHSEVERTPEEARNMLADRIREALKQLPNVKNEPTEH